MIVAPEVATATEHDSTRPQFQYYTTNWLITVRTIIKFWELQVGAEFGREICFHQWLRDDKAFHVLSYVNNLHYQSHMAPFCSHLAVTSIIYRFCPVRFYWSVFTSNILTADLHSIQGAIVLDLLDKSLKNAHYSSDETKNGENFM